LTGSFIISGISKTVVNCSKSLSGLLHFYLIDPVLCRSFSFVSSSVFFILFLLVRGLGSFSSQAKIKSLVEEGSALFFFKRSFTFIKQECPVTAPWLFFLYRRRNIIV